MKIGKSIKVKLKQSDDKYFTLLFDKLPRHIYDVCMCKLSQPLIYKANALNFEPILFENENR